MDRKERIEEEITLHLAKIKQLRAELEKEEHDLQVCYNALNTCEKNN